MLTFVPAAMYRFVLEPKLSRQKLLVCPVRVSDVALPRASRRVEGFHVTPLRFVVMSAGVGGGFAVDSAFVMRKLSLFVAASPWFTGGSEIVCWATVEGSSRPVQFLPSKPSK